VPALDMGLTRHANSLLASQHTFHHSDRVNTRRSMPGSDYD
jgi:hypothetical protein